MRAIDIHRYVGRSLFGTSSTPGEILRSMDRLGIERTMLVPVKPRGYRLGPENKRVARIVAGTPERFGGWCRVDPWLEAQAVAELEHGIDRLGLGGLFLHPLEEQFQVNADLVEPLIRRAIDLGVPVMVVGGHQRVSTAWQIGDLARRHPDATIIATSGGQINISGAALHEAEVMVRECPNVLLETSGVYREDFIEDMARAVGPDRILWGSGSPVYDVRFEIKRGEWLDLDEQQRDRILWKNAADLFFSREHGLSGARCQRAEGGDEDAG